MVMRSGELTFHPHCFSCQVVIALIHLLFLNVLHLGYILFLIFILYFCVYYFYFIIYIYFIINIINNAWIFYIQIYFMNPIILLMIAINVSKLSIINISRIKVNKANED